MHQLHALRCHGIWRRRLRMRAWHAIPSLKPLVNLGHHERLSAVRRDTVVLLAVVVLLAGLNTNGQTNAAALTYKVLA